ncbi:MAG: DUF1523 family protein [Albidovulum sp.]|nr:DUF1523 family protein [Albidovulum sp.]
MRYAKFIFRYGWRLLLLLLVIALLDYTLPAKDAVKIVGTEVVRTDVGSGSIFWAGGGANADASGNRDVRFINSVRDSGAPRVYRNEDTGWGWPPYLKFDSGDLQADAQIMANTEKWVKVTHYGWRNTVLSIYPNAVSISEIEGPDALGYNWFRIVSLACLAVLALLAWRLWNRIRDWIADRMPRWISRRP